MANLKTAVRGLLALLCLCVSAAFGTGHEEPDLSDFVRFVTKSYRLPKTVLRDCKWNYAMVVVHTNRSNEVIKIDFVNTEVSDDLKRSFDFLIGYQFSKNIRLDRRPIMFMLTVEQLGGMGCDSPERSQSPPSILQRVLINMKEQLKREPNTIIIYEPIVAVAGGRVN